MLYWDHMALTPEQAAAVEKIMDDYRKELAGILQKHKQDVTRAIEDVDKRKSEEIQRIIGSI